MTNPLDYVSQKTIKELGLSKNDLLNASQPSKGGVYHARGEEGLGKTLLIAHYYRTLIDIGKFTPFDAVGNLTFKGKYGIGFTVKKGENLRDYLWDLTHKPYRHKIVIIDEADSEFPARSFTDKDQTEISLRLWHTAKLDNYIFLTSHKGNSTDIIMFLATHYFLYPQTPDFDTNSLDYVVYNNLNKELSEWTAIDVIPTMLIYNRQELTENTEAEQGRARPTKKKQQSNSEILDDELEWQELDLVQ